MTKAKQDKRSVLRCTCKNSSEVKFGEEMVPNWTATYSIIGDDTCLREELSTTQFVKIREKSDYETSRKEFQKWLRRERYVIAPLKIKVIEFKYHE